MIRLAVLASGRGSNLQAIIDAREAGRLPVDLPLVLSDRPDSQAVARARRHGIHAEVLQPPSPFDRNRYFAAVEQRLRDLGVDLVALAGFMRLLPASFVAGRPGRIMNIHPSLLPAFPGLEAPRQALEHGVKVSGCTVHFVDEGMDSGPIILQAPVPVFDDDTPEGLAERILAEEHRIYPGAIRLYAEGRLRMEGRRVCILPPVTTGGNDQSGS